jgi:hypothetical protein
MKASTDFLRLHPLTWPSARIIHEAVGSAPARARILVIRAGPGNLGDRHWYTEDCLKQAVADGVFEGAQSYLDHPTPIEDVQRPERSVKDLAGQLSSVAIAKYDDPFRGASVGVYADFTPAATAAGDVAFGLIRSAIAQREVGVSSPLVGFSLNALGTGESVPINGEVWNQIDLITECLSVDVVTRAGAGGGVVSLLESAQRTRKNGRLLEVSCVDPKLCSPARRKPLAKICCI